MRDAKDSSQNLSRLNDSKLKNRGGKEKLKYIEKKEFPLKRVQKESETGEDFSEIPVQIRQCLDLNDVNDLGAIRNCRIVSDEYVREKMKKYGREIRRG